MKTEKQKIKLYVIILLNVLHLKRLESKHESGGGNVFNELNYL